MKKQLVILLISMVVSEATYANWFSHLINLIAASNGIQTDILNTQGQMLDTQQDIDSLMKEMNNNMTSHSGWGTYQFHDYESYGDGARDWASVMQMAGNGSGSGALGQTLSGIAKQFPIDKDSFNKGIRDISSQKYYAVQSQTILATRAASQLDYDKIQDQITYQQMLQQQIENTKDLKAAVDLNNRIQVEGNLINLEILRQSALSNQQQAINEQANVNSALSNARFLTKQ